MFSLAKAVLYIVKDAYSFSRQEEKGKVVPTEKLIEFLEFAYNSGCRKITLCGGDPLARVDIIELLEKNKRDRLFYFNRHSWKSIIKDIVNDKGIPIKKVDSQKLAKLVDVIGIPIDGSTNEVFKLFRQTNADIIMISLLFVRN